MTPIDPSQTVLDLILALDYPVILVTGTYLGALSHTLTALSALRHTGTRVQALVVSESEECVGLAETVRVSRTLCGGRRPADRPAEALGQPRSQAASSAPLEGGLRIVP